MSNQNIEYKENILKHMLVAVPWFLFALISVGAIAQNNGLSKSNGVVASAIVMILLVTFLISIIGIHLYYCFLGVRAAIRPNEIYLRKFTVYVIKDKGQSLRGSEDDAITYSRARYFPLITLALAHGPISIPVQDVVATYIKRYSTFFDGFALQRGTALLVALADPHAFLQSIGLDQYTNIPPEQIRLVVPLVYAIPWRRKGDYTEYI